MPTATVNARGQITIPASVKTALGLKPGDKVTFVEIGEGTYAISPTTSSIVALKGMLNKPDKSTSIKAMNAVIATMGKKLK